MATLGLLLIEVDGYIPRKHTTRTICRNRQTRKTYRKIALPSNPMTPITAVHRIALFCKQRRSRVIELSVLCLHCSPFIGRRHTLL